MTIWEIVGYGMSVLGIGFILWMAVRTTIRYLKNKGIMKTRKFNLKEWKPKNE